MKVKPCLGSHAKSFEIFHKLQSLLGFENSAGVMKKFHICTAVSLEFEKYVRWTGEFWRWGLEVAKDRKITSAYK